MAVERYGSKTDVVVKLVLVFFIALLSFSIGTFVGKKFSDNQHKLAQLEPGHDATAAADEHGEKRDVASVHPEADQVKPEKALTDDEIAKLAEEFVTDDEGSKQPGTKTDKNEGHALTASASTPAETAHAEAPANSHAPANRGTPTAPHAASPSSSPSAQETLAPAARMAHGKAAVIPNPPPVASRIPNALPKEIATSAIGKYTVQVGAYKSEKEAQGVAANLTAKGFNAFYVSAKIKNEKWYRVSVGLFATVAEATAYKDDLMTRAKVADAHVKKVTSAD